MLAVLVVNHEIFSKNVSMPIHNNPKILPVKISYSCFFQNQIAYRAELYWGDDQNRSVLKRGGDVTCEVVRASTRKSGHPKNYNFCVFSAQIMVEATFEKFVSFLMDSRKNIELSYIVKRVQINGACWRVIISIKFVDIYSPRFTLIVKYLKVENHNT